MTPADGDISVAVAGLRLLQIIADRSYSIGDLTADQLLPYMVPDAHEDVTAWTALVLLALSRAHAGMDGVRTIVQCPAAVEFLARCWSTKTDASGIAREALHKIVHTGEFARTVATMTAASGCKVPARIVTRAARVLLPFSRWAGMGW